MDKQYYTVREVSEIFKVHNRTVRRWIFTGKLPAIKVMGSLRISKDDIDKLKQSGPDTP